MGALNASAEKAKSDQPKPTTKAHPLDLRFNVPVAHSLVLTAVPVLEQAVVVTSDHSACDVCVVYPGVAQVVYSGQCLPTETTVGWASSRSAQLLRRLVMSGTVNCQWCVSEGRRRSSNLPTASSDPLHLQGTSTVSKGNSGRNEKEVDVDFHGPVHIQLAPGPLSRWGPCGQNGNYPKEVISSSAFRFTNHIDGKVNWID